MDTSNIICLRSTLAGYADTKFNIYVSSCRPVYCLACDSVLMTWDDGKMDHKDSVYWPNHLIYGVCSKNGHFNYYPFNIEGEVMIAVSLPYDMSARKDLLT